MRNQQLLKLLHRARRDARMEGANFDDMCGSTLVRFGPNPTAASLPRTDPVNETDYIKQRTKLFRDSWIIGPLTDAINELEREALVGRLKRARARGDAAAVDNIQQLLKDYR